MIAVRGLSGRLSLLVLALCLAANSALSQTAKPKAAEKPAGKSAENAPAKLAAPGKELIAVLDFDRSGASKSQSTAVSNQLRTDLLRTGKYTLVDRGKMETLLNEQAFQQTGCTSQDCAVQAGKVLGVRKIVTGALTKADEKLWQVALQLIDVETSEVLLAETLNHDGDYRSLLIAGVPSVAARLAAPRTADGKIAPPPIKLAVFPGYFRLNNPNPPNWQHETLAKGIDAVKTQMPITVGLSFYPQFVPGEVIQDVAGLESGSWTILGNPDEKFIAGKAAQWGQDAVLVAKTVVSGDRLTIKAYVIDAKTQRVFDQEEVIGTKGGGIAALTRVVSGALLRYHAAVSKR